MRLIGVQLKLNIALRREVEMSSYWSAIANAASKAGTAASQAGKGILTGYAQSKLGPVASSALGIGKPTGLEGMKYKTAGEGVQTVEPSTWQQVGQQIGSMVGQKGGPKIRRSAGPELPPPTPTVFDLLNQLSSKE